MQELEKWVFIVENNSSKQVTELFGIHKKQTNDQSQEKITEQDVEYDFERSEVSGSDRESTADTYEQEEKVFNESQSDIQTELIKSEHSKTVFDFPANEFYEFIGDNENKKPSSTNSLHDEEAEQSEEETILESESGEENQLKQATTSCAFKPLAKASETSITL